ncbi:GGDEF domain-containing protein [Balneatrix alpica]|uniref:GGDEF domain-containing protein n=1 Tax=Balneatrix alpica TaxID=75684 RepID=UPI0027397874|nr:diguanylate cyclase [Balneatrix alpica]
MSENFKEFHWMVNMLQTLDVGLVVIDAEKKVQLWNGFMENHSGMKPDVVRDKDITTLYPEMPVDWLDRQLNMVFTLGNKAFSTWEQRPYLFPFRTYQPITGRAEFMYQNITIIPLTGLDGRTDHACIMVYDESEAALNRNDLKQANAELAWLSQTDPLTRLFNRGYWEDRLVHEFQRFKRTEQPVSLIMFDIDHFKKVNDTYGHPAGDEVIRHVSRILKSCIRTTDIAGRYGGEEFGVILINTDAAGAAYFAERLRKQVEKNPAVHEGTSIPFTISLGAAQACLEMHDYQNWLDRTDKALYQSKHNGRNQLTQL